MFMPGMEIEMRAAAAMLLASGAGNVVDAVLHWRVITRLPGYDANDEGTAGGSEVTAHTLEFRALFHQVDHRLSGYQRFLEVQTGDIMLDYLVDLELPGKEDLRVEVAGRHYTQKTASSALLESWDCTMGNGGLFRSLLLTPV